jgi:hypothetical protein
MPFLAQSLRLSTWGNDMGELLCEMGKQANQQFVNDRLMSRLRL